MCSARLIGLIIRELERKLFLETGPNHLNESGKWVSLIVTSFLPLLFLRPSSDHGVWGCGLAAETFFW